MRALALLAVLLGCASVVSSGTEAADYVRGITVFMLVGVYLAIAWPAFEAGVKAHRENT